MTDAAPDATPDVPPSRARRMLAALIDGADLEAIAAEESLPAKRVMAILREELDRRWVAPVADFAKLQIARLENLCLHAMDRVESGELAAMDRALRIFDRLDRYHGFDRASPALEQYGEEDRAKLMAKLNAIASRLYGDAPEGESRE